MKKRGQETFSLSFGMIFSIFMIVVILTVGFFVIEHFLSLSKCSDIGLFYDGLQDEIDRAWTSGIYNGFYHGKLPGNIEQVCVGSLEQNALSGYNTQQQELNELFLDTNSNIFLLPAEKACDGELAKNKLEHVNIQDFFCVEKIEQESEFLFYFTKSSAESLVRVTEREE